MICKKCEPIRVSGASCAGSGHFECPIVPTPENGLNGCIADLLVLDAVLYVVMDVGGFFVAILAALFNGSFGIFSKIKRVQDAEVGVSLE